MIFLTVWGVGAIVAIGFLVFNYHGYPYEPPEDFLADHLFMMVLALVWPIVIIGLLVLLLWAVRHSN
jgi:hypothetical protein